MDSNQVDGQNASGTGGLIFRRNSGGEVIALIIMGMGLLTTGFFTGWIYFQVKEGIGPGKSKDKPVPIAITPIAPNTDPLTLLGADNLSWQVSATQGRIALLLQYKSAPNQAITFDLREGSGSAQLLLARQKVSANEETWTLALGSTQSAANQQRQTLKVNPRGGEKPISRTGPVPLTATKPVELAVMNWTPGANDPGDAPVQATLTWYPSAALDPASPKKEK